MYVTSNKSYCRMAWRVLYSAFLVYANSLLVAYVHHFLSISKRPNLFLKFLPNTRLNTRENIRRSGSRQWEELSIRVHGLEANMRRRAGGVEQLVGVPRILSMYDPHSLGIHRLILRMLIQKDLLVILRYLPWVLSLLDSADLNSIGIGGG